MTVSEPLAELPGQGKLAKPVADCTELSLGSKNITQLAGFERLVNVEVLWVHDNQLRAINCLDHNTRLKQLYAHNNRLCTLKGSITKLKFLTNLDISHNQLKRLDKVLGTLQKMRFLQELNLQGNPCCEEPQYRLTVLAALPGLTVLDHHEVTVLERQQAARLSATGDIKPSTIGFGTHIPVDKQAAAAAAATATAAQAGHTATAVSRCGTGTPHIQQPSYCRQALMEEVSIIWQRQLDAAAAAEAELYARNPDAAYWAPHSTLPPNPALQQAQKTWAAAAAGATCSSSAGTGNNALLGSSSSSSSKQPASMPHTASTRKQQAPTHSMCASDADDLARRGCLPGTFSYYTGRTTAC